jgi:hypothetical protein
MSDNPSDDTSIPLMDAEALTILLPQRYWPHDQTERGHLIQRMAAEMNRRLMRAQVQSTRSAIGGWHAACRSTGVGTSPL